MIKFIAASIGALTLMGTGAYMAHTLSAPERIAVQMVPEITRAPDVKSVIEVSLKSVQAQNRITTLSANYLAMVTTREDHLWGMMESSKTLLMPGRVRYEIDLTKLREQDLDWNPSTETLRVHLPPVEVSTPDIDLTGIREVSQGAMTTFSSVDHELDAANRKLALLRLTEQSHDPKMIEQARTAASRAIEQTFQMPMRAAGIQANVVVEFA